MTGRGASVERSPLTVAAQVSWRRRAVSDASSGANRARLNDAGSNDVVFTWALPKPVPRTNRVQGVTPPSSHIVPAPGRRRRGFAQGAQKECNGLQLSPTVTSSPENDIGVARAAPALLKRSLKSGGG